MGTVSVENTFSIEIEKPDLIVFRSKTDVGLNKEELKIQAEKMFEKISDLTSSNKSEGYNFLAILSEGKSYQISLPAINVYRSILSEFNINKVAIVEKHPTLIRFFTNIVNMADTSHKFMFFPNEVEAREWLNSEIEGYK